MTMLQRFELIECYEEVLSGRRERFPLQTWPFSDEGKRRMRELTRYLVIEKLQWGRSEFCHQFCLRTIQDYKLITGFTRGYKRNIYPLVTDAFPEWSIQPWELLKSRVPRGFWTAENAIDATRWLVEHKLGWSFEKVQNEISNTAFISNNLSGMLQTRKICAATAILQAYPDYDWSYLIEREGYRLTKTQIAEIRELFSSTSCSQLQLAHQYNVSPATIHYVLRLTSSS